MEVSLLKKNIFDLNNNYYIVTGGLGFLGSHFSETICKHNGVPIIIDKSSIKSKKLLNHLKKKYDKNAIFFKTDISKEKNVIKISNILKRKKICIKGLVNNAAYNPTFSKINSTDTLLENYSINNFEKEFDIGLKAALICTKIFGKNIIENQGGSIINVSSDLGIIAPNHYIYNRGKKIKKAKPVSYSIIKTALIGLTRYTSSYWAQKKIRCNAIAPSGVFNNQDAKFVKKLNTLNPLGRMLKINELDGALIFLLSNSSTYVNGHTLIIDGGRTVW